jgi:hypothetical protein
MATALPIVDIQEPGADLARKTVFIKLHLGLLGNSRKVSSSQVEVDADKALIRVSKNLLDSLELQAIRSLDGDIRRYLYDTCLPFDVGIHLLSLGLIEAVDDRLREFKAQRDELVEAFLLAYPRLCQEAAVRLRTLYNPTDYAPVDEVRACFSLSWQYISYGVPEQLGEISARIFETEREKAAEAMSQACDEIQQVMRASLLETFTRSVLSSILATVMSTVRPARSGMSSTNTEPPFRGADAFVLSPAPTTLVGKIC